MEVKNQTKVKNRQLGMLLHFVLFELLFIFYLNISLTTICFLGDKAIITREKYLTLQQTSITLRRKDEDGTEKFGGLLKVESGIYLCYIAVFGLKSSCTQHIIKYKWKISAKCCQNCLFFLLPVFITLQGLHTDQPYGGRK